MKSISSSNSPSFQFSASNWQCIGGKQVAMLVKMCLHEYGPGIAYKIVHYFVKFILATQEFVVVSSQFSGRILLRVFSWDRISTEVQK